MTREPGFAKAFAGRRRIVDLDIRYAAEFFNGLLAIVISVQI